MKEAIAIIAFLLLIPSSNAFLVSTPSNFTIVDKEASLFISIENTTNQEYGLEVKYSAPTQYRTVFVPRTIKPYSAASIEIVLQPDKNLSGSVYESNLTVNLGNETKTKKILLEFKGTKLEEKIDSNSTTGLAGLQGLVTAENLLNAFLIIIAVLLLIAFIARLTKRLV